MTYLPTQTPLPSSSSAVARELAELMLSHTVSGWRPDGLSSELGLVTRIREEHRGSPMVLSATEAALADDSTEAQKRLREVIDRIDDQTWTGEIAGHVLGAPSVGVLSLGQETLGVLEALTVMSTDRIQLVAPTRAIARGLGYLRQPILLGPAEHADTLLLPCTAFDAVTLLTYRRWAAAAWAALEAARVVAPVLHPLRGLSSFNRRAFRPPAGVVAMQRPLWP